MAHTFDIRFARSAGLAALLEAPSNSFHWSGSGRLSIDAQGVSVAVKRTLLSLLARNRTRRIPAADLKEVFREGEALRVEFATDKSARASLLFWANDRDTAAQIVRLLPTTRTVELEENAHGQKFRVNRRSAAVLGITLAVIASAIVTIRSGNPQPTQSADAVPFEPTLPPSGRVNSSEPDASTPASAGAARDSLPTVEPALPALPGTDTGSGTTTAAPRPASGAMTPTVGSPTDDTTSSVEAGLSDLEFAPALPVTRFPVVNVPPTVPRVAPGLDADVVPIPRGTLSWNYALRQLAIFGSESDDLLAAYDDDSNRFRMGQIGSLEFMLRLSNQEKRWWDVIYRILDAEDFADPLLVDLRTTLLACARERRDFLSQYSKGIAGDRRALASASDHRARAVELNQRARRYID
jgi:hypothetical protein